MKTVQQFADRCAEDFVNSFHQPIKPQELSNMDDDSQDHMKAFMTTLDSFQECFKNAVRRIIVPHLRQRNASLPISKLPFELMQRIFHATLILESGERHEEYVTTLLTLRSVSEAWRDLTNKTPTLWTHLSSGDHPSFISKAFESSGNCPLHLMCTVRRAERFELELFLDQALARIHCWESVSIHDPEGSDLRKYFEHPAPRLKRLTLTRESWDTADSNFSICGGSWELAEEIRIKTWFYELDWGGVRCRRLRILNIHTCGNLDLVLLIGIIQENKYLEILKLEDIEFTPTPSLLQPSRPPIVLSHLRALTLVKLYFNVDPDFDPPSQDPPAFHISRNIRFPRCTDFSSSLYGPEGLHGKIDLEYLTTSSPHPPDILSLASLATALSAANSLVAHLDPPSEFARLTTDDGVPQSVKFSVYIWSAPQFFLRSWIGDVVTRMPGEPQPEMKLVVRLERQASGLDTLTAFKDCEAVTELSVLIDPWNVSEEIRDGLLHLLAMPYTSGSGTIRTPFPSLRRIDAPGLLQGAGGNAILDMIKTRFNAPGVNVDVPETIVVHGWGGKEGFKWPDLDGIREMHAFREITFV